MRAAIIVPFHDPVWFANVTENLGRQSVACDVVFAVNGKAAGFDPGQPTILSGESHADAVNAGAEWCKRNGYTHAICLDSDDYYGPGYVAQALVALTTADFVGKRSVYVWLSNGLHSFDRVGGRFLGGTLGFELGAFVPMHSVHQDDTDWCERMAASCARGADTGPAEYCYVRHGGNAHWRANDVILRKAWGPCRFHTEARISWVSGGPGTFHELPAPTDAEIFEAMQ